MLLKANPKLSRQLALEGPQALWRDKVGGGREGLLITCAVCPDPACTSRHVLLSTRWVEEWLISARLLRTKLVMRSRPGMGEVSRPGFYASVGVDDGVVELRDQKADPAAVAWFKAELDAELRAVLLAQFQGARRRIRESTTAVASGGAPSASAVWSPGGFPSSKAGARALVSTPPPTPARRPGRNDPCPCGSGRKYKRCCLGRAA